MKRRSRRSRPALAWKEIFSEALRYLFFAVYAALILAAVYGAGKSLGQKTSPQSALPGAVS